MTITNRYFDVSASGLGDGTSYANRAALFDGSGNWSTVITGFDFSAGRMRALVTAGSYTCNQTLQSSSFTTAAPTIANLLHFHGCDSSGNILSLPDPNWTSDQSAWDASGIPTINMGNGRLACDHIAYRLMKFSASATNATILGNAAWVDWCQFTHSGSGTSVGCANTNVVPFCNCVLTCSGSIYNYIWTDNSAPQSFNTRFIGNAGSSGNRRGVVQGGGGNSVLINCTILNNGSHGFYVSSVGTGIYDKLANCTIVGNGGDGIQFGSAASQTARQCVQSCMITGNGGYGINAGGGNAYVYATQNRLRNNTSGNLGNFGNYPTDISNETSSGTDANEYVDTSSGDYRIKNTSSIWGYLYGASEQPAATGSGTSRSRSMGF